MKTEAGSLPEGKVKIKLEHDGTILDVDEDDIEKVRRKWLQMVNGSVPVRICSISSFYVQSVLTHSVALITVTEGMFSGWMSACPSVPPSFHHFVH